MLLKCQKTIRVLYKQKIWLGIGLILRQSPSLEYIRNIRKVHYNRARPTLLIKERRQHSYDTYDYDSTVFHNDGFTTPCIMDFSLTMIPVLNGPKAENN